jgi:hypothetical protein
MIRRAFLSTLSAILALAVAPFGWLFRHSPVRPFGLPPVQGVKDSTKSTGLEIDWLAWNDCPPGEPRA